MPAAYSVRHWTSGFSDGLDFSWRTLDSGRLRSRLPPWQNGRQMASVMRDRLKALRQRLGGATQEELAILVGVHVSTVRAWEQELRQPSKLALKAIEKLERGEE